MRKVFLIFAIICLMLFSGCGSKGQANEQNAVKKENVDDSPQSIQAAPKKVEPTESLVTVSAIGDVLIHSQLFKDARTGSESYNFKPMFATVKPLLSKSDLAIANQESIIGGTELGISSYPLFNSPFEVADALKDAGIDIVSTANNHSLDKGEKGILNAIQHYEQIGLPYVGSFKNEADANTWRIQQVNGVKIGFLSYTYGTNGIPVPKNKPYLVNLIDEEKMKRDLDTLNGQVDVTIVNMHWGEEYQSFPSDAQKQWAQLLVDHGADIIIGHHPHVLQPIEWLEGKNGNKSIVVYSLGNFLSGQKGDGKDIGGIFSIDVIKRTDANGTTLTLKNPRLLPTYVTKNKNHHYYVELLDRIDKNAYEKVMKHMHQWLETKEVTNSIQ